jgi:hypothetical protein
MSDLPEDTILSHIDFAENYSFKIQNEIQSMYWFSHQVTILVHLTYKINPLFDPEVNGFLWIKESQSYILDDKEQAQCSFSIAFYFILDDKEQAQCSFSIAFYFIGSGFGRKDSNQDNIRYLVMVVLLISSLTTLGRNLFIL